MLELRNIELQRRHPVLKDINLTFEEGKIYGIIGKSGAGKTSLLKIAAGLMERTSGEVYFENKRLPGPTEKLLPGHDDIQLVNQDFALDPYHTVEENVRVKVLARRSEVQTELVNEFLALVELDHLCGQKALHLSGGEQQRLALARALACEPKVLLLDEPFVHLDQQLRWKIQAYLREVNKIHKTIMVLVSHDGAEMMGFAEEVIHLRNAVLERRASAEEMYFHPSDREQGQLMGPINEVLWKNERVCFRPNEYKISNSGIEIHVQHSLNTGPFWLNTASSVNGEKLWLQSDKPLEDSLTILIQKQV